MKRRPCKVLCESRVHLIYLLRYMKRNWVFTIQYTTCNCVYISLLIGYNIISIQRLLRLFVKRASDKHVLFNNNRDHSCSCLLNYHAVVTCTKCSVNWAWKDFVCRRQNSFVGRRTSHSSALSSVKLVSCYLNYQLNL